MYAVNNVCCQSHTLEAVNGGILIYPDGDAEVPSTAAAAAWSALVIEVIEVFSTIERILTRTVHCHGPEAFLTSNFDFEVKRP